MPQDSSRSFWIQCKQHGWHCSRHVGGVWRSWHGETNHRYHHQLHLPSRTLVCVNDKANLVVYKHKSELFKICFSLSVPRISDDDDGFDEFDNKYTILCLPPPVKMQAVYYVVCQKTIQGFNDWTFQVQDPCQVAKMCGCLWQGATTATRAYWTGASGIQGHGDDAEIQKFIQNFSHNKICLD